MEETTFLDTLKRAKNLFFAPFISKIAKAIKNIRVKGTEKHAVSLCNRPEKQAVSLRNGLEK